MFATWNKFQDFLHTIAFCKIYVEDAVQPSLFRTWLQPNGLFFTTSLFNVQKHKDVNK